MQLKFPTETLPVHTVDADVFESFVLKYLGFEYSFTQMNEVGNDSTTVARCPDVIEGANLGTAEDLLSGAPPTTWCPAQHILYALRVMGLIEPGLYLIDVCW
jgi:hypothetical protein